MSVVGSGGTPRSWVSLPLGGGREGHGGAGEWLFVLECGVVQRAVEPLGMRDGRACVCVPVGVVGKVLFLFLPLPSLTKSEEELQTLEGGGCKRIGALAHSPPKPSPTVCMQSLSFLFPPCRDSDPAILPGLWPGSALSSAVLMAVADPDAPRARGRGAGEASCLEGA